MMTSHTPAEFSNNQVKVHVHYKPHCLVELEVHASPEMIQKARQNALKSVKKSVSLPGFRKGKAPDELITKKFTAQIEKELHQELADLAYREAQTLTQVPRLNNNAEISYNLKKMADTSAELSFTFETEPTPPSVDPSLFVAKSIDRPQVTQKEIDEAVRQMQYFYAEWAPITDRPVEEGDLILINLDTRDESGNWSQVFNHVRFEVSHERMANWMQNLVKGAKAGDVLEGLSEPDADATEEEKNTFKPKPIRLTILKAEKVTLPPLDEEFAKKVGAPNPEAMVKAVTDLLNSQADSKVLGEKREQINDFLIETYPFDLPNSLVMTETKHRLAQAMQNRPFKDSWDRSSQEEKKEIVKRLENESSQAVRLFFLSHSIVQEAKIPITHKLIADEAAVTLQSFGKPQTEQIPKEVYALALSKVVLTQAQNHILNHQKP
jgi:trigger factor